MHTPDVLYSRELSNQRASLIWASSRKPVLGFCDQIRLKPAFSATETSQGLECLDIASRGIIWPRRRTSKAIRLRGCAGWSAHCLFAYGKTGFLMTWLTCKFWGLISFDIAELWDRVKYTVGGFMQEEAEVAGIWGSGLSICWHNLCLVHVYVLCNKICLI